MPLFLAALLGGLISAAGSMLGRALIALGVGFITYQGFDVALDTMKAMVIGYFHGLPAFVLQGAGMLKLDAAVSVIFSALSARLVLNGIQSGVAKKFAIKGGQS